MAYWVNDKLFARAEQLISPVHEHAFGVPHPKYKKMPMVTLPAYWPRIHSFGDLPVITTDLFELGVFKMG